jgi:hypothetical protein
VSSPEEGTFLDRMRTDFMKRFLTALLTVLLATLSSAALAAPLQVAISMTPGFNKGKLEVAGQVGNADVSYANAEVFLVVDPSGNLPVQEVNLGKVSAGLKGTLELPGLGAAPTLTLRVRNGTANYAATQIGQIGATQAVFDLEAPLTQGRTPIGWMLIWGACIAVLGLLALRGGKAAF